MFAHHRGYWKTGLTVALLLTMGTTVSAQAGVGVARTSYLPRTDLLWQSNRATDNNITGLTFPELGDRSYYGAGPTLNVEQ